MFPEIPLLQLWLSCPSPPLSHPTLNTIIIRSAKTFLDHILHLQMMPVLQHAIFMGFLKIFCSIVCVRALLLIFTPHQGQNSNDCPGLCINTHLSFLIAT
jgi:hypothetical protein